MKNCFLLFLLLSSPKFGLTQSQERIELENLTFVVSGINFIKDDGRFANSPIGKMESRIDSIFKSSWYFHHVFKSYNKDGEFVGEGSFHVHAPEGKGRFSIGQTDSILINYPNSFDMNILFLKPSGTYFGEGQPIWSGTCHYNWLTIKKMKSGMLWGSQTGLLFSGEDIQRMSRR